MNKKKIIILTTIIFMILFSFGLFFYKNRNVSKEEINLTEIKNYLARNYDNFVIDGSTSTIPLHKSLNKLFSITNSNEITHNKTVEAFEKFIDKEIDILFGVDYSDELLEKAKNKGIDLVKLEITREAFVFLINKSNPINDLTIEQIRDIYSGKITNWKQVGGDDALINAYQRNSDSGSQIRMEKFMDNVGLIEKDVEYISSMGSVVETISNYDQGKYSIAYNMYTFTEKQYANSDVSLLKVNGIQPNDETIFNETYPITIYNYLYYDKNDLLVNEFVNNLYSYLMSDEGQKLISESGYVNLNKQYDINKNIDKPYENDNEKYIGFYNEEKEEFYGIDENGKLLVFKNYSDYVLCNSKYKDNNNAQAFLNLIFNSEIEISSTTAILDKENGYIVLNPWFDASLDSEDFFNYKYNNNYYSTLKYFIDEDKYILTTESKETFDSYLESSYFDNFTEYTNNYTPNSILEITRMELENLYFRFAVYDFEQQKLNYFQPFK